MLAVCPAEIGGVKLFQDGISSTRRVLLGAQKSSALNGLYETVPVGGNLFSGAVLPLAVWYPPLSIPVVAGTVYRFVDHVWIDRLVNGGQELTDSGDFVAAGNSVLLYPTAEGAGENVLGTLQVLGLVRALDAEKSGDFGASTGGKRVEVLAGSGAGIWEFAGVDGVLALGSTPLRFTRLGGHPVTPANPGDATSNIAPQVPEIDLTPDRRPPQTVVPPKSGADSPTNLSPALPLLGIRGVLTIQSAPVTVSGEAITCLF